MIYKESKGNLLKQGLMKKCPVDWRAINNLMKRAYTDLRTAKRNIDDDEECAVVGVRSCNSTLKKIAEHLGFHYATISRGIKRVEGG